MTDQMFDFLNVPIPAEFFENHHIEQILTARSLNGPLTLLSAIQLLLERVSDSCEIQKYSEYELVIQYINILIKIKSDLKKPKNIIEIELDKVGVIDKTIFLVDLDHYDFKKIKTLREWINFLKNFSNYRIHSRSIRKLVREITSENQDSLDLISKRDQASKARQLIFKTLDLIPEGEQKRLLNMEKGKKGLKNEVREIITQNGDYQEYFDSNEKTFANRWSEVLGEIKAKLLK